MKKTSQGMEQRTGGRGTATHEEQRALIDSLITAWAATSGRLAMNDAEVSLVA